MCLDGVCRRKWQLQVRGSGYTMNGYNHQNQRNFQSKLKKQKEKGGFPAIMGRGQVDQKSILLSSYQVGFVPNRCTLMVLEALTISDAGVCIPTVLDAEPAA